MNETKLHLGCGKEILPEYINSDIVDLPGVDVVHNLMFFPWPWEDESMTEIRMKDLIEHLPTHTNEYESTILKVLEEAHRILKPDGLLWIQTPSWKADFLYIDVTHTRGYDLRSFDFVDGTTDFGKSTDFYTKVKFKVNATELENHNLIFELRKEV